MGRATVRRLVPLPSGEDLLHLLVVLLVRILQLPGFGRASHLHFARVPPLSAGGAVTGTGQRLGRRDPRGDVPAVVGAGGSPKASWGVRGERVESRVGRGGGQARAGVDDVGHPLDQARGGGTQVDGVLRGVGRDVGRDLGGGGGRVDEARVGGLLRVATQPAHQVEVLAQGVGGVPGVGVPEIPGCVVARCGDGNGGGCGCGGAGSVAGRRAGRGQRVGRVATVHFSRRLSTHTLPLCWQGSHLNHCP